MKQRALQPDAAHVAIIMDGNGRWARRRRRPRGFGHREGARAVRRVVETAADPSNGIERLTLYAFSSDNWHRPRREVDGVMTLFDEYLRQETPRCIENDVRLRVIGRRDRLAPALVERIRESEAATSPCTGLLLRLAVDYSARDVMARAAQAASSRGVACSDRAAFQALIAEAEGDPEPPRDVDLLIRTGGEQRLSDFLLWECAYAELYFTGTLWPDFGEAELLEALREFRRRERRFGRVLEEAS